MSEALRLLDAGQIGIGDVVIARHQTSGRGQRGNAWTDQPGDALLATFVSELSIPAGRFGLIALSAGVASARGLAALGATVGLKWPNDIMIGERKLGGVLIQTRVEAPLVVLTGIGINLHSIPAEHKKTATSLNEVMRDVPGPTTLAALIGSELETAYQHLSTSDWDWVLAQWRDLAIWIGDQVSATSDGTVAGRLMGIDEFGHLEIATDRGTRTVAVGSLERGPRPLA